MRVQGCVLHESEEGAKLFSGGGSYVCMCWGAGRFVLVLILRKLAYLVIYDSGWVSLEHLLLSRHPSPLSSEGWCRDELLGFGYQQVIYPPVRWRLGEKEARSRADVERIGHI